MKIQRALRAHWALESGKRQIHCVLTIQVKTNTLTVIATLKPLIHFINKCFFEIIL